jgi:hypothetical protein
VAWQSPRTGKRRSPGCASRREVSCSIYISPDFTLGQHDFLLISEMPDARAATVISLAASGGGGIQDVVTTQAFTTAEARALFEQAGKVAGSYKPMGAS